MSSKADKAMYNPFFCLTEETALCLSSSLKGSYTCPIKRQLFHTEGLQGQLSMGQESILHNTRELAGPRMSRRHSTYRLVYQGNHADGKLAGSKSCYA